MDWFAPVDIYCERVGVGFWAEPVNALSNLAFVAAAVWAAVVARGRGMLLTVWLLIGLAGLIGVGSFLFHTFANGWSEYADTVPIWSFVALYVMVAMQRIGGVAPGRIGGIALGVAAVLVVVFLASGEGDAAPGPLNRSGQYAPALVALGVFAAVTRARGHVLRHWALAAALVFALSLMFRTVDLAVCAAYPLGSHFMWHLLNGLMVAILLQMLVREAVLSQVRA